MSKARLMAGVVVALAAHGAAAAPVTREQGFELMARPGSWIEAYGDRQADGSLVAKDIEIYAPGDTAELEEPALYGAVEGINRAKSTMRVLGYVVTWDSETTIKDENKRQILSSKLDDGIGVKVQGGIQANGTFKASKIKLQDRRVKNDKVKIKEKIFGPVTIVDELRSLRVLNTPIVLTPKSTFVEVEPEHAEQ